jgi:chemotaxis protein methyltransferase CheR
MHDDGIKMIMDYVQETLGLSFHNGKSRIFEKKVRERLGELGVDNPFVYYLFMKHKAKEAEIVELLEKLSVGETYFFREEAQFIALRDEVLGRVLESRPDGDKEITILSAGCSTGEEPYTLAMIARHLFGRASNAGSIGVRIVACDVNTKSLAHAAAARYSDWSIRHLSAEYRDSFLVERDGRFEVRPDVRELVELRRLNLNDTRSWVGLPGFCFDVVFCRNVLMYFADDRASALAHGLFEVLRPGGFLFTATTESPLRRCDRFSVERINGAYVYRK